MIGVPRTLFGRHLLLIVALIVVAQLGAALLVRELILEPRLQTLSEGLVRTIQGIRTGLQSIAPPERTTFVDAFNRRALDERGAAPGVPPGTEATVLERRFIRSVSDRLADDEAELAWRTEAGGGLALILVVDSIRYRILLPGVLPDREFTGAWAAASIAAALLALLGAYLIQRHLNRPLARVVAAAGAMAQGRLPPPLPEDGPIETGTLARSFNRMVDSLASADRDRALMLAGISHDLRTPLTKLRLGVEIARDRIDAEVVASMTRSIGEMDAVVGQFIEFARATGDEPLTSVDLDGLALEIAAAAADHGQPVAVASGGAGHLPARTRALRRAILNLVENAFRHGRAPVRITTGRDRSAAWIEVVDAGEGIPPDQVAALRAPFRRGSSVHSGPPGSGLGLAIADRVARDHGGSLELGPAQPSGWRARLVLPRSSGS